MSPQRSGAVSAIHHHTRGGSGKPAAPNSRGASPAPKQYPEWLRELIYERAKRLHVDGDQRPKSAVIRQELYVMGHKGILQADIDSIFVGIAMEYERRWNALENGIRNARGIADEAAAGVWRDVA